MENENIKAAKEKFDRIQDDREERELAWLRQKYFLDKKSSEMTGFNDGYKQGSKEKTIEIAKKMKDFGEPVEEIVSITGLAKEEIEKL